MIKTLISIFRLSQKALQNLQNNDPVRMAGATAFFSFFALPPIVIILTTVLSPVVSQRQLRWQLFRQFADLFGPQGARQLQVMSRNLQRENSDFVLIVFSLAVLLLASTTLFAVIQNSLNQLWNVKAKPGRRFLYGLRDRVVALVLIVASGVLFVASLALDRFLEQARRYLPLDPARYPLWAVDLGNFLLSVAVVTVWFAIIFKYLPDVRIRWRAIWTGALVTSTLFQAGELILNRLLIRGPISSIYGASGAVILLLLFVFYSALIFYFGAAFTRCYAEYVRLDPEPKANAIGYEITERPPDEPDPPLP
jgi:membrane protein